MAEDQYIKGAVVKEVRGQTVKWLVGGGAALLALAAVGWWGVLRPWLVEEFGGVPPGAVMAFDLGPKKPCPDNWSPFGEATSRFIIGAGNPGQTGGEVNYAQDDMGRPLSPYKYRQHGGEEDVQLTVAELPSHTHSYQTKTRTMRQSGTTTEVWFGDGTAQTSATGEDKPHNNIPPYIALYYCRKN